MIQSQTPIIRRFSSKDAYLRQKIAKEILDSNVSEVVGTILRQVRENGDAALIQLTEKYDSVRLKSLAYDFDNANVRSIDSDIIRLFEQAADNIRQFHQKEFAQLKDWQYGRDGWRVGQRVVPIQRVGIYVPGGTAAYPSSVLMNVIPAQVAGVPEIVMVSPPDRQTGEPNQWVSVIARMLGIREFYTVGGAQAVAALAYGTETIRPVDKITGPGNRYVAEAKRQVFGPVGIDSIAGPSEIVIVADASANPVYLAADLLSQAEHDAFARAILISPEEQVLDLTEKELRRQLKTLPRVEIAGSALFDQGALISVADLAQAIDLVNQIAPEHLELQTVEPKKLIDGIRNAGAIFIGPYTPEPVGDYWAGSNHILPTSAAARYASALSVRDFLRWISLVEYDQQKLLREGDNIMRFARLEGLEAHARAVEYRLDRVEAAND